MPSPTTWRALTVASLAFVLAVAACGDDEPPAASSTSSTAAPAGPADPGTTTTTATAPDEVRTIQASFAGGAVVGGSRTESVVLGEEVRIEVTGDATGEVHLHGYDRTADVTPTSPAVIELTADLPGVWEVELEGSQLQLVELQVEP